MTKAKRYDEGGVTEGANKNIDDDTRSRAMAWLKRQQEGGDEAAPPAKSAARRSAPAAKSAAAPAAKSASRSGSVEDIPKSAPAGWKGGSGERASGSELGRNVANTLSAMGPGKLAGLASVPGEMRAGRAAQQAYNQRAAMRRAEEGLSADEAKAVMRRRALSEADTTGGAVGYKKGGSVGKASSRADGIAQRGKTRGRVL